MSTMIETSITLPKDLFDEVELLAQRLNISHSQLHQRAIENFMRDEQNQDQTDTNDQLSSPQDTKSSLTAGARLVINQGDVYWLQIDDAHEGESSVRHPHVVLQENVLNHSRISTVVVCALTSNIKRAAIPGSVLLEAGEANLPKQSVVEASKVSSVDKRQIGDYIGSLSEQRVQQILAALRFLQTSYFER